MSLEIEYKYLVKNDDWKQYEIVSVHRIVQVYLTHGLLTTRIRLIDRSKAVLNMKIPHGNDATCHEYEYEIPYHEGVEIAKHAGEFFLTKKRHTLKSGWEIDVFEGVLEGLVLAELEVPNIDHKYIIPSWIGKDVTKEASYRNVVLAMNGWKKIQKIKEAGVCLI